MGKTYKKLPQNCVRTPKGRKQALINKARRGAIPPNSWDDIPYDNHCYVPYNVAYRMQEQGKSQEEIRNSLKKKFKLRDFEIEQVLNMLG